MEIVHYEWRKVENCWDTGTAGAASRAHIFRSQKFWMFRHRVGRVLKKTLMRRIICFENAFQA